MIETVTSETIVQTIEVQDSLEPQIILVSNDTPQVIVTTNEPGPQGAKGEQGSAGIQNISQASDVNIENLENGSLLVYSQETEKWVATRLLEQQAIESGHY